MGFIKKRDMKGRDTDSQTQLGILYRIEYKAAKQQ